MVVAFQSCLVQIFGKFCMIVDTLRVGCGFKLRFETDHVKSTNYKSTIIQSQRKVVSVCGVTTYRLGGLVSVK